MDDKKFTVADLSHIIEQRKIESGSESYTAMLLNRGKEHIERKLLEETLEVILESHDGHKEKLLGELGDLFFHALVLASYHDISLSDIENYLASKNMARTTEEEKLLEKLENYRNKNWAFSGEEMINHCSFPVSELHDILLFSHNFRKQNLTDIKITNRFSNAAKIIMNSLQGKRIKPKLVIRPTEQEKFVSRRSAEELIPVLFVLNSVFLPLTINVLASYIKDYIDKKTNKHILESEIEINIGIKKNRHNEEAWYQIKGTPEKIYEILNYSEEG